MSTTKIHQDQIKKALKSAEPGSIINNSEGHYIGEVVISLAAEYGFPVEDEDPDRFVDGEGYGDLWDSAEEYLNSLLYQVFGGNPPFLFGSNELEGSWGLWATENEDKDEEG